MGPKLSPTIPYPVSPGRSSKVEAEDEDEGGAVEGKSVEAKIEVEDDGLNRVEEGSTRAPWRPPDGSTR